MYMSQNQEKEGETMNLEGESGHPRPRVEVCLQAKCHCRGAAKIREEIVSALGEEIDLRHSERCFRLCKSGPNVAVNGNILSNVRPGDAVRRVRAEIRHPSRKFEGIGSRPMDDLDKILDEM